MEQNGNQGMFTGIIAIILALSALFGSIYPNLTYVDEDPPLVGILDPSSEDYLIDMILIRALIFEASNYSIAIRLNNTIIGTELPLLWNSSELTNGHYELKITVTDSEQNQGEDAIQISIINNITIDSDHDGLADGYELELGTDPFLFDSDIDNFHDGYEILMESDPLNSSDYPDLTIETYNQLLASVESNHSLLMEVYAWLEKNVTQLENVIAWSQGNASQLEKIDQWLIQNSTLLYELLEAVDGNFTLLEQIQEWCEGNATILDQLMDWSSANASLIDNLYTWSQANATLLEEIITWTQGNASLLQELITNQSISEGTFLNAWNSADSSPLSHHGLPWQNVTSLEIEFNLNQTASIYVNYQSAYAFVQADHFIQIRFLLDDVEISSPFAYIKTFSNHYQVSANLQHVFTDLASGDHSITIQYYSDYISNSLQQNSLFVLAFEN